MPPLIRFLLRHALIGFGIAAIFVAGLMLSDMGGIGTLIANAEAGWLALLMLTFFLGLTFGSAQMGFAVMSGDLHGGDNGRGGKRQPVRPYPLKLLPVKIRSSH
ncbi:MAG: hypothetical protein ACFCUR_12060 [Rhodomicrobiaceae bacterium]